MPVTNSENSGKVLIRPELCPQPATFQMESCRDSIVVDAAETSLQSLGRIVQVDAVVKNVCPGKRVAVALLLSEEINGTEQPRGMKTLILPPQEGTVCQDVELKCVPFVVPEEMDAAGQALSLCQTRTFRVRVLANYMDTDYVCCALQTEVP